MGRELYVDNLPYSATAQSLRDAFAAEPAAAVTDA